jgi:cobalt/nickel transport system permease protein
MKREVGWFRRLDPRAKFIGVVVFVVATALMTDLRLVLLAVVASVILAATSRVSPVRLGRPLVAVLPVVGVISISSFFYGGLEMSLAMLGRSLASVLALLVMVTGTDPFDLWAGLRRIGCPAILASVLMLVTRYIDIITDQLRRMGIARRARGFRNGRSILDRAAMRVNAFTAGSLLVRSVERADRVYEGLKSKAFTREFTYWKRSRPTVVDGIFLFGLASVGVLMLMLQMEVVR